MVGSLVGLNYTGSMNHCPETLAHAVDLSKPLLTRYLAGFDDGTCTRQAPHLPNHAAWTLGHCALYMHRLAERIDGGGLPEPDFSPGVDPARARFGTEEVAMGSRPVDDPARYPSFARCVEVYERACDRLAGAVRGTTPEGLAMPMAWGASGASFPVGTLVLRVVFHNGSHTGQLADLRRALGFKGIL